MLSNNKGTTADVNVTPKYLPIRVNYELIDMKFMEAQQRNTRYPVLAVVTGTKPDFYKQAPLVDEAIKQNIPTFVIDTGQHYDETLGHGIREFGIQDMVACTMQLRGDLMEKASELLLKFASFGRICKNIGPNNAILPIVHGDTLVAGITPLSWLFGMGQRVAQNEAGLRSMAPEATRSLSLKAPDKNEIEDFIHSQFEKKKWFIAREEPFPEQVDTWICSAGTQYFFAPTMLNKENLVREGYPEENIFVVGNSVVDAIQIRRNFKPKISIFEEYPELVPESSSTLVPSLSRSSSSASTSTDWKSTNKENTPIRDEWIRVDIHRRENLTRLRFFSIVESVIKLVKLGYKVLLIKLTATEHALQRYGLNDALNKLATEYPRTFVQTPLWKEYGQVIEFLDSGVCWLELTDSGSMQEELLYFPKVKSVTVRLNTDRPETIFDAQANVLAPPISSEWIVQVVRQADSDKISFMKNKKIYGEPGEVSRSIIRIIKKRFEENPRFRPWLHERLRLSNTAEPEEDLTYL
jgi:UDP-N-acetylglucosamine 2-epimerase